MKRFSATVKGRVQGVGFRAFVADRGRRLGLRGWVKNEWDGNVKVRAEGEPEPLATFVQALKQGPSLARVDGVDVIWDDEPARQESLPPFEIR